MDMKYMGIDYGTEKIGLALSDEAGEFAFPKGILERESASQKILAVCQEESIGAIILGQSVASNGAPNALIHDANRFAEKLKATTGLPVYFEREDFSSVEAHRYQIKAGARDDSAAAIILQRFLDKNKKRT
jgi:putative Holliday junction resolvase